MPKFAAGLTPLAASPITVVASDSRLADADTRSLASPRPALLPAERDPLSPARGFMLGLAVAVGFWAVGGMTAYLLL